MDSKRGLIWRELLDAHSKDYAALLAIPLRTDEIAKDVRRTQGHVDFFATRQDALTRILAVFAATNPLRYVQGMSQIAAPLFYVLQDEGQTFWAFTALIQEIHDIYDFEAGLPHLIASFWTQLSILDLPYVQALEAKEIHPSDFAPRWFCCLFAAEFELPDLLTIWDSFFPRLKIDLLQFLVDFACAMMLAIKPLLQDADFDQAMATIQAYPCDDVFQLIASAVDINAQPMEKKEETVKDMLQKFASRLAESDAAASLAKVSTNAQIRVMNTWVAARLVRPPSPTMDPPFTPPKTANHTPKTLLLPHASPLLSSRRSSVSKSTSPLTSPPQTLANFSINSRHRHDEEPIQLSDPPVPRSRASSLIKDPGDDQTPIRRKGSDGRKRIVASGGLSRTRGVQPRVTE